MSARRAYGEDSVYKDGDRWRGAISLGYNANGKRARKKVSGRTRAEAVEKLRKLRQQVDGGTVPDDRLTVKAFLTRWLTDNVPGTVAESTEDDYNDTVRLHLIPALGQKRLSRLSVAELDKLWRVKRAAGYSTNSGRIMRTVLRRALGQAEREGIIARNVAALSAPPRVRAKEGRTLTVEQARHLLDAATGHRFELVIILALAYGMRRGEVPGLRWSALDWDTGTLQVSHSVQRIKSRGQQPGRRTQLIVGELKTPGSRRSLALTPEILAKLRQHHTRQAGQRMAAGRLWRDQGLIFASETGAPLDPENFSRAFAKLCNRAGLGHWHPHELRHSGASLMLAQGTPLHVVSEILGHASITITKDVYGHLVEGDRRAVAASMSRALFGTGSAAVAPHMAPNGTEKAPPRSG
jgi:integrase